MKVPDKHFVVAKAKKYLFEDIGPSRYIKKLPISGWQYIEFAAEEAPHNLDNFKQIPETELSDISQKAIFGGYDRTAWFKTSMSLPEDFINPGHSLRFTSGTGWGTNVECLLYVNDKPIQGLDMWHMEALLPDGAVKDNKIEFAIKCWCGLSSPSTLRFFGETDLTLVHPQTEEFYFTALAIANAIELLNENDLRRIKLTNILQETFTKITFLNPRTEQYYNSIETALDFLKQKLEDLRVPEIKPTIHAVGHSHIDMAWLWRLAATREKASRTFSTVLNLMAEFSEYYFMHSSPQLYQFLEEDYPEIFEQVKEKIKDGRWEATGGMWVEADTNIPSGESLVRQFLYGKRYFKEAFGVESKVLWLPDVFGYSAALPQIAKKSGMDYFMTTKISWNQYNHFPYDTFIWRGLDGTEILTHFITTPTDTWFYTYNGEMTAREIPGIWENYRQKSINDQLLLAYGFGDGGGGPTREMLMTRRALEDVPGIPYVKPSKVEPYFKNLEYALSGKKLETWDGELYFEYHRGTYTSQGYNKKANRRMENQLHNAEFLSILRDIKLGESDYPKTTLDEIWQRVLLLQFHDIIPGTSIRQVYEDSRKDYEELLTKSAGLIKSATDAINATLTLTQDSVVVYNNLSWRIDTTELFVPFSDKIKEDSIFVDSDGYTLECQKVEGGFFVIFTELPPLGYKTYAISVGNIPQADDFFHLEDDADENKTKLETNFYNVEFNKNGEITSLYDKLAKRHVGSANLNVLEAFEDKPMDYDAWDIDVFYKEKPHTCFTYSGIEKIEQGNLRTILRRKIKFNKSEIEQDMIFYTRNRRIDFVTKVSWRERQTLLKAAFPLDIRATNATYDIQFGFVERANHNNNERDFAQFEVSAHKWADVSESGYGVALFNDCKYGYDCKDSVLRITLLKSPIQPDETADIGEHEFTYALYPHLGNLVGSYVQTRAAEFNCPVLLYEVPGVDASSGSSAGTGVNATSSLDKSMASGAASDLDIEMVSETASGVDSSEIFGLNSDTDSRAASDLNNDTDSRIASSLNSDTDSRITSGLNSDTDASTASDTIASVESDIASTAASDTTPVAASNFAEFSLLKVGSVVPQLMDEDPSLHVVVDTVKKAEDGNAIILRVYESNNRALGDAIIWLDESIEFTKVTETNLMEENAQDVKVDGQGIIFDIKPFEIKTFRIELG